MTTSLGTRLRKGFEPEVLGADRNTIIGHCPISGVIDEIGITVNAALTANATNYRSYAVYNRGAAGTGTAQVGIFATDTVTTDDVAANTRKLLTITSTLADKTVAAGDVLELVSLHVASGIADPGGVVDVHIANLA